MSFFSFLVLFMYLINYRQQPLNLQKYLISVTQTTFLIFLQIRIFWYVRKVTTPFRKHEQIFHLNISHISNILITFQ